jgi:hypothetical protein
LAKHCNLSRQGVINQIGKLETAHLLSVSRSTGGKQSNRYYLFPAVNGVDRSAVNAVDYSSQRGGLVQSTALTTAVNGVDPNHHITVKEPSLNQEPTFEQAMEKVPIQLKEQVRLDFARMVFEDWDTVGGKNGAGVSCRFEKLLQKRWNREGEQWQNNCHTAQKKNAQQSNGPSLISRQLDRQLQQIKNIKTVIPE